MLCYTAMLLLRLKLTAGFLGFGISVLSVYSEDEKGYWNIFKSTSIYGESLFQNVWKDDSCIKETSVRSSTKGGLG
jgi:hypothetical protein